MTIMGDVIPTYTTHKEKSNLCVDFEYHLTKIPMEHPIYLLSNAQHPCTIICTVGSDVCGVAKTGSGKTAAFAMPILQRLGEDPHGLFAIVLTPTRWIFV